MIGWESTVNPPLIAMPSAADTDRSPPVPSRRAALLALSLPCLLLAGCENVSLGELTPPLEDDSPLANAVRAELDAASDLAGSIIRVKSLDGDTIRLSGTVQSDRVKRSAERVASSVPGVRSVVNTLFIDD